jgi:acetyl esterase/lipase
MLMIRRLATIQRNLMLGAALCLTASVAAGGVGTYDLKRDIVYAKVGETKLLLDGYIPRADGPFPAVLVVHGGAWIVGNKRQLAFIARSLAERGIAAFAINYRLAPKDKFPAQIEDCRRAVRWIVNNAAEYKVDAKRLGALGYSAGAHLVALLGTQGIRASKEEDAPLLRLRAVAAGGTPVDFRQFPPDEPLLSYWLGGTRKQVPEQYKAASPLGFVDADTTPMYLYHGDGDALVPVRGPKAMAKALEEAGVESKLMIINDVGHIRALSHKKALEGARAFLAKHLAKRLADEKKDASAKKETADSVN